MDLIPSPTFGPSRWGWSRRCSPSPPLSCTLLHQDIYLGVGLKLGCTATDILGARVNACVQRAPTVEETPAIIIVDRIPPIVVDAPAPNVRLLLARLGGSTSTIQC